MALCEAGYLPPTYVDGEDDDRPADGTECWCWRDVSTRRPLGWAPSARNPVAPLQDHFPIGNCNHVGLGAKQQPLKFP